MRRILHLVLAVALASGIAGATAGSALAKAKPKGKVDDPCTLLDASKVGKVFGGPVAEPKLDTVFVSCTFEVGDDPTQSPGGSVAVAQLFPHFGQALPTATEAFQDQHAIDVLSNFELADIEGLGRDAYMNLTNGTLVVLATKKFEFSVSWSPASVASHVATKDQKKLVKLAKQIVTRAPK
jgi:hypothetical protein